MQNTSCVCVGTLQSAGDHLPRLKWSIVLPSRRRRTANERAFARGRKTPHFGESARRHFARAVCRASKRARTRARSTLYNTLIHLALPLQRHTNALLVGCHRTQHTQTAKHTMALSTRQSSAFAGRRVASAAPVKRSACRASRALPVIECKRVAVLGAAGGIGQPLSLLLKMNKCVTELALYDIGNVKGVAADLSHCNTPVKVCCVVWGESNHRRSALCLRPLRPKIDGERTQHNVGDGLHWARRARGGAQGLRPGDHSRRRAAQARHDARRPL